MTRHEADDLQIKGKICLQDETVYKWCVMVGLVVTAAAAQQDTHLMIHLLPLLKCHSKYRRPSGGRPRSHPGPQRGLHHAAAVWAEEDHQAGPSNPEPLLHSLPRSDGMDQ